MEFVLAKIYLIVVFAILLITAAFLIIQIRLRQNLENTLAEIQLQSNDISNSYEDQFKLGQIYLRKKIYNKAIQEFRLCFKNWEKNDRLGLASLFNTLGFTYYQLEEYEIASYYYKIALRLTPDYITCLTNLAYIYQTQNDIKELKKVFDQITKYDPTNKKIQELKVFIDKRI